MKRYILDIWQGNMTRVVQAPKPVLRRLDCVDTIAKATHSSFGVDALVFCDKRMYGIALKRIKNFVIARVVCVCAKRIPRTGSHALQHRVLLDTLQAAFTATFIQIAL